MRVYLDHNATSPLRADLQSRWVANIEARIGNPGSTHREGQIARGMLERARQRVLRSMKGDSGVLTFTSGATEANNIALQSLRPGDVLVTTRLEHPSLRDVAEILAERGIVVRYLSHDSAGTILLSEAEDVIRGATLVAVTAANNEIGNFNPVVELADLCAKQHVGFHIDAAQVWGRYPFEIPAGTQSVTLSAHKAGGPIGIGALWAAKPNSYPAMTYGGQQERGRRAGTENVILADLMSAIVEPSSVNEAFEKWSATAHLRDVLVQGLMALGGLRNGDIANAMPNTLNISFPGFEAEELVMALDLEGVAISAGSACTAGSMDVSPVIAALGFEDARTASALRFSLGPQTTLEEIEFCIARVEEVISRGR